MGCGTTFSRWFAGWALSAGLALALLLAGCDRSEKPSAEAPANSPVDVPVAAPAPATPPAAKVELVELVRQPVGPEATTVRTADGRLTVTIPAGTFTQPDALVISSLKGDAPPFSQAFQPVAVYDIATASHAQPGKPVTVTLNSGERPARAAWRHEELDGWLSIPAQHDPTSGVTRFDIPHFTAFGWFSEAAGYQRKTFGDFEIIWDAQALDVPKSVTDVDQLKGKVIYDSVDDFARYLKPGEDPKSYDGLPELVRDAAVYLNHALRQYKTAGFKVPKGPVCVVIETTLTSENARDKALGIIHIGEYNNTTSQLKLAAAHELFHAVQNEYLWALGGMTYLGWWCESTAEYAGSILWGSARPARKPAFKYFSEALTATANEHDYQSAHFIDCVIGPGTAEERLARLRKLWVGTLGEHGITDLTDITFPMTAYLKSVDRGGVNDIFRDHVSDLFFSETSPIVSTGKGATATLVPAEMMEAWALLESGARTHPTLKMNLKGGRRAKAWGVRARPAANGADREIEIKVGGPLSGNVQARVHVLPDDLRSAKAVNPTAVITQTATSARVTLGLKDTAYVVVINTAGGGEVDMTLDIKEVAGGEWRLLSAEQVKTDAFAPNLKMMSGRARVFSAAGDPFIAWAAPAAKMDLPRRVTYEFDAQGQAGELRTITAWKETIYSDTDKQEADLKLTITRRWTPALPPSLKPGSTLQITEQAVMEASPATQFLQSRYKPKIIGLVITTIDRQRLGGSQYTHVDATQLGKSPLEAATTHRWSVPSGSAGDRLRIVLRAADSAPADLGQSSGAYMDEFQFAQLLYVYEYRE